VPVNVAPSLNAGVMAGITVALGELDAWAFIMRRGETKAVQWRKCDIRIVIAIGKGLVKEKQSNNYRYHCPRPCRFAVAATGPA
jgi:hypothetical protein